MRRTTLRELKPADIVLVTRPVYCCEIVPEGIPGEVLLGNTGYQFEFIARLPDEGEPVLLGFRFSLEGEEPHDVMISEYGLECDCRDCQVRQRACKHIFAVKTLRERGDI